jgi:hypothetical protein
VPVPRLKYVINGRILEAPNVSSTAFCERVRQPSHDVVEEALLVWACTGSFCHRDVRQHHVERLL